MANTNTGNQQKKVYTTNDLVNLGQQAYDAVDEQAILDKYNQATAAQFAAQQDQNRVAENNFYNQMYNTQKTAMDTIRQSNANAVSTGASRGVQAANELSALLGLQQESIASATEIANARRQTAQEETAAMLQNIVQASQDAAAQRQQALQSMIQAQSLKATEDQAAASQTQAAATQAQTDRANKDALATARAQADETKDITYLNTEWSNQGLTEPGGAYYSGDSVEARNAYQDSVSGKYKDTHMANYQTFQNESTYGTGHTNGVLDNWQKNELYQAEQFGLTQDGVWTNFLSDTSPDASAFREQLLTTLKTGKGFKDLKDLNSFNSFADVIKAVRVSTTGVPKDQVFMANQYRNWSNAVHDLGDYLFKYKPEVYGSTNIGE